MDFRYWLQFSLCSWMSLLFYKQEAICLLCMISTIQVSNQKTFPQELQGNIDLDSSLIYMANYLISTFVSFPSM